MNQESRIKNQGFTLIELLVVVAIIGLLLSIISVSFTSTRQKTRDTKRLSDMKQIKTALDLYYTNGGGYPDTGTWVAGTELQCSGTDILLIPKDPSSPLYQYTYTPSGTSLSGCGGAVRGAYTVQFYIEKKSAYYTMDEEGTLRNSGGTIVSFDSLLK